MVGFLSQETLKSGKAQSKFQGCMSHLKCNSQHTAALSLEKGDNLAKASVSYILLQRGVSQAISLMMGATEVIQ